VQDFLYSEDMALKAEDRLISIEDYLEGELFSEIKHEYLGGTVHAMSGGKIRHGKAAGNVFRHLGNSLDGKPYNVFNSDNRVRIVLPADTRFYYPDAMVACGPTDDDALFFDHPVVVIEVLSPSTRRNDIGEKRDAYLTIPSLKVYLVIDPEKPLIKLDRRKERGGLSHEAYQNLSEVIPLPEIEIELALADIYFGISLPEED